MASGCDIHGHQHPAPALSCPVWPLPPSSLSHPHAASSFLSSLSCPSSQLVNIQLLLRAKGYGCHLEAFWLEPWAQQGATVPHLETFLIVTTWRCCQPLVAGGQESSATHGISHQQRMTQARMSRVGVKKLGRMRAPASGLVPRFDAVMVLASPVSPRAPVQRAPCISTGRGRRLRGAVGEAVGTRQGGGTILPGA